MPCLRNGSVLRAERSPYGVLIDGLVEEQDIEAEETHQQGVERGHGPAETRNKEIFDHKK